MFQAKFHAVDPPAYSQRHQVGRQSASTAAMSELFILQAISLPVLWQTVPPEVGHEEAHLHSHRYGHLHYLFYFLPACTCRYYLIHIQFGSFSILSEESNIYAPVSKVQGPESEFYLSSNICCLIQSAQWRWRCVWMWVKLLMYQKGLGQICVPRDSVQHRF